MFFLIEKGAFIIEGPYTRIYMVFSPRNNTDYAKWKCVVNAAADRKGQDQHVHYENTPIQIYRKFHLQKLKNFR